MRTPFFSALLAACLLHMLGLVVASLGWQAWPGLFTPAPPDTPVLVAVVPVPAPLPPEPPPEAVSEPIARPPAEAEPPAQAVPEPIRTPPAMSSPPAPPVNAAPAPQKREKPRLKPTPPPPVAHVQTPKSPPPRAPLPRHSLPAPGRSDEPPGTPGSGTAGAAAPPATAEQPHNTGFGGGADAGQLSAHGGVPVLPGSGSDAGGGGARASTGSGAGGGTGGGTGTGRGGGAGVSARPVGGYQVKPAYPESARRQGVEGTVLLKMRITERGSVEEVRVERSAGHPDLDRSALEAVRRWRFEPARRGGEPVAMEVLIPVEFKLQ